MRLGGQHRRGHATRDPLLERGMQADKTYHARVGGWHVGQQIIGAGVGPGYDGFGPVASGPSFAAPRRAPKLASRYL